MLRSNESPDHDLILLKAFGPLRLHTHDLAMDQQTKDSKNDLELLFCLFCSGVKSI